MTDPKWELECVLGSIRGYAVDHKLSAEQIGAIFDLGVAEAARQDLHGVRLTPGDNHSQSKAA